VLVTGQPDEMLRDQRNSNGSRELFVMSMEILVSGDNHNVLNLVFSLCMSECLDKAQDTAM
jgi:hypothetical protein